MADLLEEASSGFGSELLEDHLVLFVDFLGFSEAARRGDPLTATRMFDALRQAVALGGDFSREVRPIDGNAEVIQVRPAISAFSDQVIASYPLRSCKANGDAIQLSHLVRDALWLVGYLATVGLSNHFLIRGGLAVGKLFHQDGVVFGEGLLAALDLERKLAVFPRIAMSPQLVHALGGAADGRIRREPDGVFDLNYFGELRNHDLGFWTRKENQEGWLRLGYEFQEDESGEHEHAWRAGIERTILDSKESLARSENWVAHAKWSWFQNKLEERLPLVHPKPTRGEIKSP